jgi:hypothetical protein
VTEIENGTANVRGIGIEGETGIETRGNDMVIVIARGIGIGITISGIIVG